MTYRVGSWVVDKGRGEIGRLMGHEGPYIQLRPPGGGREWDAPPEALRLATVEEQRRAGVRENQHQAGGPGNAPNRPSE
ncbi:hypothetical protein LKL35_11720 [Streptomyces sp. ET3-23]|uniref:hypothetical protein n=1 Tax=Streptomyces sp. ET3-23 TaxID=2885643 RepID=UPI001D126513|nr:hypothetical protein [Streptomyces sp. ET3-23]MCC2276077.1 hypothetical protein [Streptomyces sp. ET3-23]